MNFPAFFVCKVQFSFEPLGLEDSKFRFASIAITRGTRAFLCFLHHS